LVDEGLAAASLASPDEDSAAVAASSGAVTKRLFWVAALAVACVAALAAAGAFRAPAKPASLYQRTMAIAGEYRCPVCAGESAASSDAPAAVEIRQLIAKWLEEGKSPAQIRARLVGDYGSAILEKPPAAGFDVLVWALPGLAALAGAGGLAIAFARWRRNGQALLPAVAASGAGAPASTTDEELVALERAGRPSALPCSSGPRLGTAGQPTVLEPPSRVLEPPSRVPTALGGPTREPASGGATASATTGLTAAGEASSSAPSVTAPVEPTGDVATKKRSLVALWRRFSLPAGAALVALAVTLLLVDHFSSPQLPGGTITGSLTGLNSELEEAQALTAKDPAGAIAIYQQILKAYPDQPIALTAEGWIFAEAGLGPQALARLTAAEDADPSYGLAHLYRGLVLLEEEKKPKAAAAELEWYLAHDPSPNLVPAARRALQRAQSAQASAREQAKKGLVTRVSQ